MEQVVIILTKEIARLQIIEKEYLELVSNQKIIPVIELKVKNPKRVAAGIASAKKVKEKKELIKEIHNELLECAQLEWETSSN